MYTYGLHNLVNKHFQQGRFSHHAAWQHRSKDRKVVTVMSSVSQPTASGEVIHRHRDGTRTRTPCPQPIIMYNEHMGGIDRGDQLRGYYCCRTMSRKFYTYFLLDVAITNAFILYKTSNSSHKCLKDC